MTVDELIKSLSKATPGSNIAVATPGGVYEPNEIVIFVKDEGVLIKCGKSSKAQSSESSDRPEGQSRGPMPLYEQRGSQPT